MQQTKLIQLLRCFNEAELKQFDSFVESPYYNRSERLIKLYRLLAAYQPDFDSNKLDKEKIFARMYGKTKYNDLTMRELSSSLFQLVKEFIAIKQLKQDELEMSMQRYLWLQQHGTIKQREQEIEAIEKLLGRIRIKDDSYYMYRWMNDFAKFEYTTETYRDVEHKLMRQPDLGVHLHSLNRLYIFRYLESYYYILDWASIYNQPFDRSVFEHIEELALKYVNKGETVIDIYFNLVQLAKTGGENYYSELKTIFFANDPGISRDLKINLSIGLANYCIMKLRVGQSRFASELLELYRFTLKHEYARLKTRIPFLFYQNVVIVALETGEIDWAEQFINEYKNKLEKELREDVYQYCRAFVVFEKGQFNEALTLALSVDTSMYFNKIELKGLVSRIQYELGMFDQVEVMFDSYKYYLADDKVSQGGKEMYSNFIDATRRIMRLYQNFSTEEFMQLSEFVEETPMVSNRRWLKRKVAEIGKKKAKQKV